MEAALTATKNLSRFVTIRVFLTALAVSVMLIFSQASLTHAAPYGSCAYGESDFSASSDDCVTGGATDDGDLSGTGQNWKYLVFAAAGLLLGASSLVALFLALKKRHAKAI